MPYVGRPDTIIELPSVGSPGCFVTDNGSGLKNRTTDRLCKRLHIDRIFGHKATPTDRPQVEALFRVLKDELLGRLPGFAGGGVNEAGEAPAKESLLWLFEAEVIFARYIVDIYDQLPHSGLRLLGQPTHDRSPAEMRNEGIARCGLYLVPVSPTLYYEALPLYFRLISDRGVRCRNLQYDGEALNPYRGKSSGINPLLYADASEEDYQVAHQRKGDPRRQWPFRRDPRDISRLYFQDPETLDWHAIPCIDVEDQYVPFSDVILDYARATAGPVPKPSQRRERLTERLNDLLRQFSVESPRSQAERRVLQKDWLKQVEAARDRARGTQAQESAINAQPYTIPNVLEDFDSSQLDAEAEHARDVDHSGDYAA